MARLADPMYGHVIVEMYAKFRVKLCIEGDPTFLPSITKIDGRILVKYCATLCNKLCNNIPCCYSDFLWVIMTIVLGKL